MNKFAQGLILAANAPTTEAHVATVGALLALAEAGILQHCRTYIGSRQGCVPIYQLNQIVGHAFHNRPSFEIISDDDLDDLDSTDEDEDERKCDTVMSQPTLGDVGTKTLFPSHSVSFPEPVTPLGQAIAEHIVPQTLAFVTTNHELTAMRLYWAALWHKTSLRMRFCCRPKSEIVKGYYTLADQWSKRVTLTSTWNEAYTYTQGRSLLCLPDLVPKEQIKIHGHRETGFYTMFSGYNTTTQKSVLFHNQTVTGDSPAEWISEEHQASLPYYTANLTTFGDVATDLVASSIHDPDTWGGLRLPNCSFESNLQLDPTLRHAADLCYQLQRMPFVKDTIDNDQQTDWVLDSVLNHPSRRVILLDGIGSNSYFQDQHPHICTRAAVSIGELKANNAHESVQLFQLSDASFCNIQFAEEHNTRHEAALDQCIDATTSLTTSINAFEFYRLLDWGYHVATNAYVPPKFQTVKHEPSKRQDA